MEYNNMNNPVQRQNSSGAQSYHSQHQNNFNQQAPPYGYPQQAARPLPPQQAVPVQQYQQPQQQYAPSAMAPPQWVDPRYTQYQQPQQQMGTPQQQYAQPAQQQQYYEQAPPVYQQQPMQQPQHQQSYPGQQMLAQVDPQQPVQMNQQQSYPGQQMLSQVEPQQQYAQPAQPVQQAYYGQSAPQEPAPLQHQNHGPAYQQPPMHQSPAQHQAYMQQQIPAGVPVTQSPQGVSYMAPPPHPGASTWEDSASESSEKGAPIHHPQPMQAHPYGAQPFPQQQQYDVQQYQPYNPALGPRPMPPQPPMMLGAQGKQGSFPVAPGGAPGLVGKKSVKENPNIPNRSYALDGEDDKKRTNTGNTRLLMALLSEMWIVHSVIILGATLGMSFYFEQWNRYTDEELWNVTCYWKLGWLLPLPYTLICFLGLALPFRTPKFLYHDGLRKRRCDNLYILTVTRGNNREAVYRAWNGHKHLERLHPSVRVHVLTDEPFFFENINCYTCPKAFSTARSKYKARALEWYRQTMRYTEHDWVLHLDEESVIDDESVRRCLEFIWYESDFHMGQGVILYNQYQYWKNWVFTVADALRVGDDLSRFQIQFSYLHRPVFGCHGSFLMNNGLVENSVTWDLGSLTEDYEFAMAAWSQGYKCGKVPGFIREQSPQGFMDFLKQRRRWFVGIWRLPHALPKIWAFFWTLGIFSLYGTIASVPLGFIVKFDTPRWFGLCKDFTFSTFVYLYILGVWVQDVDKGKNPLLIILHIPITFIVQYIAVILEALSVMYGIVFPPKDFDVIKK